jgi:hypothetical protein
LGFVIVTHPFHPLNGQRLEILYAKRRGPDTVFVCAGGVSGQITLPESWTDRGEPPGAGRLGLDLQYPGLCPAKGQLQLADVHQRPPGLPASAAA